MGRQLNFVRMMVSTIILSLALVEHNVEAVSKRRRQAVKDSNPDDVVAVEIKMIYVDVMNDMKKKFDNGDMSSEQKVAATNVITKTQTLLGVRSFEVLGLQVGDRNSHDVFAVLKEYKESGKMTEGQNTAMRGLAEDTQVRMIQGILGVFGYTAARAATEYGVPEVEMEELLARPSFSTNPAPAATSDTAIADIIATTTTTPTTSTATIITTTTIGDSDERDLSLVGDGEEDEVEPVSGKSDAGNIAGIMAVLIAMVVFVLCCVFVKCRNTKSGVELHLRFTRHNLGLPGDAEDAIQIIRM